MNVVNNINRTHHAFSSLVEKHSFSRIAKLSVHKIIFGRFKHWSSVFVQGTQKTLKQMLVK